MGFLGLQMNMDPENHWVVDENALAGAPFFTVNVRLVMGGHVC